MKSTFFTKFTWIMAFYAFIFTTGFYMACTKDVVSSSLPTAMIQEKKIDVEKAKVWFETNQSSTFKWSPNWAEAKQLNIGDGGLEVPVLINGASVIPTLSSSDNAKKGATRLLIQADEEGNIHGCILQYLPTEKFVGAIEAINWATAGQLKFDGLLFLKDLEGGFLGGISLKEGRIASKHVTVSNKPSPLNGASPRLLDCYETYYLLCVSTATYGTNCRIERGSNVCVETSSSSASNAGSVFNGGTPSNGMGGSTNGTTSSSDAPNSPPIHCSSFSFETIGDIGGRSYQEAIVQGIKLHIPDNSGKPRTLILTTSFYVPHIDASGNVYTAQNARDVAVEAVNIARENTEAHFGGSYFSPGIFTSYFTEQVGLALSGTVTGAFAANGACQPSGRSLPIKAANQYPWYDYRSWAGCP
jgi:hypothetical protein